MNFNTQVCTTREQSERLLALGLKKETADCHHWYAEGKWYTYIGEPSEFNCVPAWSLHRLVSLMPNVIGYIDEGGEEWGAHLYVDKHVAQYDAYPIDVIRFDRQEKLYDNLIDCIEWLIKENHFNKQHLNESL